MTNNNIETLLSQILDKLNRVEANMAQIKQEPEAIKKAIDTAVEKLGVPLNRNLTSDDSIIIHSATKRGSRGGIDRVGNSK